MVMVFDYPVIKTISYPFLRITGIVKLSKGLFNLEGFFFFFWIVTTVMRFAILLYFTTALLGNALRIKEFEPLILPISWLTIIIGNIPKNVVDEVFVFLGFSIQWNSVVFIALPIILWILSLVRRNKVL